LQFAEGETTDARLRGNRGTMMLEEEKQDIQLHFRVTRREKEIIDQKMAQMDTMRFVVYLRNR